MLFAKGKSTMRELGWVLCGIVLVLLAACQTPFQPDAGGGVGGFSERRVGPKTWDVTFHGNEMTSESTVYNGLVLRCAQIAVAHGYRYFVVERHSDSSRVHEYVEPGSLIVGRHGHIVGYQPAENTTAVAPGQTYRITLSNTLSKRHPNGDARATLAAHPELSTGAARIDY